MASAPLSDSIVSTLADDSSLTSDSSTTSPADSVVVAEIATSPSSRRVRKSSTRREFIEKAAVVGVGLAGVGALASKAGRADSGASSAAAEKKAAGVRRRIAIDGASARIADIDPDKAVSLLDEVGRLRHGVAETTTAAWQAALTPVKDDKGITRDLSVVNPRVAAVLHLWLGEYALNAGEDPEGAERHFKAAKSLAPSVHDRLHGWSVYNLAINTVYQGNYGRAAEMFHDLLHHEPLLGGFSRKNAALFGRHMNARGGAR